MKDEFSRTECDYRLNYRHNSAKKNASFGTFFGFSLDIPPKM